MKVSTKVNKAHIFKENINFHESRKNQHGLRSRGRRSGAWLQYFLRQTRELPHVGHVVQGQQPQPILQVDTLTEYGAG